MGNSLEFNNNYSEEVRLKNGRRIKLRLVCEEDKIHLINAFKQLSPDSRYKRFFGAKSALSRDELSYFTEMDQYHHFALGAMELDAGGLEISGVGIARFIRLSSDSECAEVGITVVDSYQGEGAGQLLLERLISAAVERKVKRFRFECLATNKEVHRLVEKVGKRIEYDQQPGVLIAEVLLPDRCPDTNQFPSDFLDNLSELMRAFALKGLKLQSNFGFQVLKSALDTATKYGNTKQNDLEGGSVKN